MYSHENSTISPPTRKLNKWVIVLQLISIFNYGVKYWCSSKPGLWRNAWSLAERLDLLRASQMSCFPQDSAHRPTVTCTRTSHPPRGETGFRRVGRERGREREIRQKNGANGQTQKKDRKRDGTVSEKDKGRKRIGDRRSEIIERRSHKASLD